MADHGGYDIAGFSKLDDRYFTVDICSIPVVDMERNGVSELSDDLFERMEQYRPDDAGFYGVSSSIRVYETQHREYPVMPRSWQDGGGLFEAFVFGRTSRGLDKVMN